ncbi:MAG: hypothetical protein RH946_19460 [Rhodospirillales bacterium]
MTMSISAFAADVPASLIRIYAASIAWSLPDDNWIDLDGRRLGQAIKLAQESTPHDLRDRIYRDLEAREAVSKGGATAVLMPACADDTALRDALEELSSDRARALKLFLHNKPSDGLSQAFQRAEALLDCGARNPGGQTWKMFNLTSFSRDWEPGSRIVSDIQGVIKDELRALAEPERHIEIDSFVRPALVSQADGPVSYMFIANISDRSMKSQNWIDGSLQPTALIPNRVIVLSVSPHAKTLDCGRNDVDGALATAITNAFARKVLKQTADPEPLEPANYSLRGLCSRPRFVTLPEDGIESVEVKKLVVMSGPGTRTYHVSSRRKGDAYDVAKGPFNGDRILSASLRVIFAKGGKRSRQKAVGFDITLPNRCTLKNTVEAERLILERYLPEWGLIKQDDGAAGPLLIREHKRPLADLINVTSDEIDESELVSLLGDGFETLKRLGVLTPAGRVESVSCPQCSDGHLVDLAFDGSAWMAQCPRAGLLHVSRPTLSTCSRNLKALAIAMADKLPIDTATARELLSDRLYLLGVGAGSKQWTALFAPSLHSPDDIDAVMNELRKGVGKGAGILITNNALPQSIQIPGKHLCILIDDLFLLLGGRLEIDEAKLGAALQRKSPPKKTGRPSLKSAAVAVAALRKRLAVRASTESEEVQAIMGFLSTQYPNEPIPIEKTVRYEWLADHFRDWSIS